MEPQEYLKILRRWWWVVAGVVLVATAAGFVTAPSQGERIVSSGTTYSATITFIVDPSRDVVPLSIDRAAFFTTTGIVPERVAERIGFDGAGAQLAAQVTAVGDPALGTLQISTVQPEADRAVEIAQTFGEELVAFLDEQGQQVFDDQLRAEAERLEELEADLALIEATIDPDAEVEDTEDLVREERRRTVIREIGLAEQRLSQLSSAGPTRSGLIVLENPEAIPQSSGSGFAPPTDRMSRVAVFGLFGLVLGLVLALVVARFDTRLRTRAEVEDAFCLPVIDQIGLIPRSMRDDAQLLSFEHPGSPMAEEYRSLRATLAFAVDGTRNGANVIAVTSALPGEGKSTTVANLAAAFAEHGDRVIVINADFRRSTTNRLLSVRVGAGLSDLLANDPTSETPLRQVLRYSPVSGIKVLTQGDVDKHPAALLRRFPSIVAEARSLADVVLIDTAPVLAAYDVAEIIPSADLVAVLCRVGKVREGAALRAGEIVRRSHPQKAGVVLVGASTTISSYGGYGDEVDGAVIGSNGAKSRGDGDELRASASRRASRRVGRPQRAHE